MPRLLSIASPPRPQKRIFHYLLLLALCLVTVLFLSGTFSFRRRSIWDITEGKTSGPWRPEWDPPSLRKGSLDDADAKAGKELAAWVAGLANRHSLGGNSMAFDFMARRMRFGEGREAKGKAKGNAKTRRPNLTQLSAPFTASSSKNSPETTFSRIRPSHPLLPLQPVGPFLQLPIAKSPLPSQISATPLLIALSTTYARLTYASSALLHDFSRWLTSLPAHTNGATLLILLHQGTSSQATSITTTLHTLGVSATVIPSPASTTPRYASLIQTLLRHRFASSDTKFFALVDDDVFLPALGRLLALLQKYETSTEYLGIPSERSDWIIENSTALTYGGGAVFLTPGMLDLVGQEMCLQDPHSPSSSSSSSPDRNGGNGGKNWDVELFECLTKTPSPVSTHVTEKIKLKVLGGKASLASSSLGYSSGRLPLALHRYRNYHRFEAGRGHLVASVCGEVCFLSRFQFADGWVLVNGYTLTKYPGGVQAVPNRQQHQTDRGVEIDERLVVLDEDDTENADEDDMTLVWKGRKKTWRLLDATLRDNGEVWQAYINRRGGGNAVTEYIDDRRPGDLVHHDEEEKSDSDSVIVLIWEPET